MNKQQRAVRVIGVAVLGAWLTPHAPAQPAPTAGAAAQARLGNPGSGAEDTRSACAKVPGPAHPARLSSDAADPHTRPRYGCQPDGAGWAGQSNGVPPRLAGHQPLPHIDAPVSPIGGASPFPDEGSPGSLGCRAASAVATGLAPSAPTTQPPCPGTRVWSRQQYQLTRIPQ